MSSTESNLEVIRQNRGITLEGISSATKICVFYLRAIEMGQLDKLPGEFYARSYVRQYAQAIGYNEDELVEAFGIAPQPESEPSPTPALSALRQRALQIFRTTHVM